MLPARFALAFAILVVGCRGAPEPGPASPSAPEPPVGSASEPAEEGGGVDVQATLQEALEFAEAIAALATSAEGQCHVFADGLSELLRERADWLAQMRGRAEALKEENPEVGPEWEQRFAAAMQPVSQIAEVCAGDPRFEAAMAEAFEKQVEGAP